MNGQTLVARVAVAAAVYSIDRPYDYSVPSVWRDDLREGQRVIVPFGAGNRKTEGIVLELAEAEAPRQLKALAHVFDDDIVLTPEQKGLALWMCRRYFCTFFRIFAALFCCIAGIFQPFFYIIKFFFIRLYNIRILLCLFLPFLNRSKSIT